VLQTVPLPDVDDGNGDGVGGVGVGVDVGVGLDKGFQCGGGGDQTRDSMSFNRKNVKMESNNPRSIKTPMSFSRNRRKD
jgi:hypothetical protein